MVIDRSAVLAILLGESDAESYAKRILSEPRRLISAFTALEVSIVIEARKGPSGGREWELLMFNAELDVIPFSAGQQVLALEAWREFGKGRHPARLNIGDCCSYALAKHTGEALLYKGDDFSQTDIASIGVT
ncbi:MAG: type II toxin-antitoxin system VapC family toxin [Spirochaetaceae bacterium]|nr:type II toxin-antitoxin system VapC family toxin [Spirochaetaceae bacterium]